VLAFMAALPFLIYLWVLSDYWSSIPKPTRNYAAEINAEILSVPQEERAWPRYREALVKLERPPTEWESHDYHPQAARWPEVVAYLQRNQRRLAMLREASALPHLGYPLRDAIPREDMVLIDGGEPVAEPSENPLLISVVLWAIQELGLASDFVAADAHWAAEREDPQRALDDLLAVFNMADHVRETPFLVSDLTSWHVFSQGVETAGTVLNEWPDLWSDDQLSRLAARIAAYSDSRIVVRTTGERMMFEDIVQRCYTDDGQGGGHFHELGYFACRGEAPSWQQRLLGPLTSAGAADRRELVGKLNEIMDRCDEEYTRPLWQRSDWSEQDEAAGWYFLLPVPFPDFGPCYEQAEETTQRRDALLVAIALVRHRAETGSWPRTLSALVPDLLEQIPPDRCDGQPLRLRFEDGRPVLYSVGFDGDDDKGEDPDGIYRGSNVINRLTSETDFRELDSLDGDWTLWPPSRDQPPAAEPPDGIPFELPEESDSDL
jgi:hypothetical protein